MNVFKSACNCIKIIFMLMGLCFCDSLCAAASRSLHHRWPSDLIPSLTRGEQKERQSRRGSEKVCVRDVNREV